MSRLEPLTLTGHHVRLSPLGLEHAPALLAAAESRATYALTLVPADLASMEAYVASALAEQERGESMPFVVKDEQDVVVGSTRYMSIEWWPPLQSEPPGPPRGGPDALEIGFTWYAERVQRTALNTEAKLLLCEQAFERWSVRRVTWKTDARNTRSRAAILRLGARLDGVLRAHRPAVDGRVRDTAFYSMLADEWPEAKRGLLKRLG